MLSFALSKAGALTAAAVLGLGGLGAYALTSVPDSKAPATGKPTVRTEVVHRTRHVSGPPREAAASGMAETTGLTAAAESEPASAPSVTTAAPTEPMADEGEEIEAGDDDQGDSEATADDAGEEEELGDD